MIVERNLPVPMRDGIILRADVWRPSARGRYPVLVMRTPYNKLNRRFDGFVEAGYIVVCQDVRGRFRSEGTWESFLRPRTHDAEDGYDTIEWAARLAESTGKVGTFGASYNGFVQWRTASQQPPSLVAMSAQTIPARYTDLEGPGTIRPGRRLKWWLSSMTPDLRRKAGRSGNHSKTEALVEWGQDDGRRWLDFLPWSELPREAFEDETEAVQAWLARPHLDPWRLDADARRTRVPNLDIVGWHDHCNGDLAMHRTITAEGATAVARKQSRVIIGPWSHNGRGRSGFGNIRFGPHARVNLIAEQVRWFDYWLKGRNNGVDRDPRVRLFVMGDNRWRDEHEWPLSRAVRKVLYLDSDRPANTAAGAGRLVDRRPGDQRADRYVYDPRHPVPSLHGTAMYSIPADQRPHAAREDILVYQTEPLTERIEVTGNVVVELFASSSARDTDFFARLIDVAPGGIARDVALGMVRTRYRRGLSRPELLRRGEVVKYRVRLSPTSNAFLPGHRIRLDVTSSDFPNYDRNHNTAADQNADAGLESARQTIWHGGARASRMILPSIS